MSPTHVNAGTAPAPTSTRRAGAWFLHSGIQERNGGVARYYRSDLGRNAAVSTEITGYAVSTFVYLHSREQDRKYLDAAVRAAQFLLRRAWDSSLAIFPFEYADGGPAVEPLAYFFDTGIIARALVALWRATGEQAYLDAAIRAGESLERDFVRWPLIHPILALPGKEPLPHTSQWSRRPGCYQLKSALAWYDLFTATRDIRFSELFERALAVASESQASFLPAETPEKTMDRLHAYSYFLEALLAVSDRPEVRSLLEAGIGKVGGYLRQIAPVFERSDVYAQLLRVRVLADDLGAVALNADEAEFEASRIPLFQLASSDARIDGGFVFGLRKGQPTTYVNPVSTGFCLQALEMWRDYRAGIALDRVSLF